MAAIADADKFDGELRNADATAWDLTPTPYAVTAENAESVTGSAVTGTINTAAIPVPLDLSGATATPIIQANPSSTGGGVLGNVTSTTSTTAGVEGATASTTGGAVGVYGLVSSSSPGGYSAGVYGVNNGTGGLGIGVYGSQDGSGWGVFGTAPSGYGVYGYSGTSGTGVVGGGYAGDGVLGTSASAIGVSGAHPGDQWDGGWGGGGRQLPSMGARMVCMDWSLRQMPGPIRRAFWA